MKQLLRGLGVGLPIALVLLGGMEGARAGDLSNVIFSIEATNDTGTGSYEVTADQLTYSPGTNQWTWSSSGQVELKNEFDEVVALLSGATVKYIKDPIPAKAYYIDVGFAVYAGMTDTDFTIKSALLSFPTLDASLLIPPAGGGRSTASYGVTDQDGNGVTLLGIGPNGSGAYTAQYNGFVPGGTTFANLVNMVQAGPGGSGNGSQTFPGGAGYAQINANVYDMSIQSAFTLTANDLASGTTSFRILPEPSAGLGLAALALLVVGRRR